MNTTKETLKIYWRHAWRYPRYVVALLTIVPIATIIFRVIPPLIVADIINQLSNGDFQQGNLWGEFGGEIILFAALIALGGTILYRVDLYLVWKLEAYVTRDILRTVFNKYMQMDTDFHANNFGGSLVSRANKLSGSYVRFADSLVFQLIPFLASFLAIMVLIYPKSPAFVYSFSVFAILFILATFIMGKKVRDLSAIEAQAENANTGTLADAVTNVMAVKSFATFKAEKRLFEKTTDSTRLKVIDVMRATLRRDFVAAVITASMQISALIVAVAAVVNHNSELAVVFLLFNYTAYLTDHLFQFNSSTLRNFNRSMGDAYEATVTLCSEPKIKDIPNPIPFSSVRGSIEFKNVSFDHDNDSDDALFENLNLRIKPGEKIGLVGHSGGGKSTLTKLIMRLMDIEKGQILIDGQDISKVKQDQLRTYISYVPQDPVMFHRSLMENISYGKEAASEREIFQVAKMAHADKFIQDLPKGYNTLVGERGIKLSGGQRQRITIARAMLKNAPILLLDEATSALDSESEKLIQDALFKLMENKTAIVVAHRLSTIQKMDRILVLENGEVVEEGTHKELIHNDGIYSELWSHQSGGFLEE